MQLEEIPLQEYKQKFKHDGYFVVRGLLSAEEIESIKKQLTELTKLWPDKMPIDAKPLVDLDPFLLRQNPDVSTTEAVELKVRRFFRMSAHDSFFEKLAKHPKIVTITNSLIGEDVKLLQSMAICKPPGSGVKRWHQDNAYFRLKPNDVMAFWISVDPANINNGCMHVVPGSHINGISPHGSPIDMEVPKGQEHAFYGMIETPPKEKWVPIELEPGDALVFHGEIQHFTPPNQTQDRRRAVQFHYASSHCIPVDPQFWYYRKAEILVSGKEFGGEHI